MSPANGQSNVRRVTTVVAVALVLILLLIYMQGGFTGKVTPGTTPLASVTNLPVEHTAVVTEQQVGDMLAWPGVVKSRTVADIAPRLTARIVEIKVNAGDIVKKGDVIARLDERDLRAQEKAALAALAGANAHAARARAETTPCTAPPRASDLRSRAPRRSGGGCRAPRPRGRRS